MKRIFQVNLLCPFCKKDIGYNILSFKAKHECAYCKNDLIVRTKPLVSSIISIIGFAVIFGLMEMFNISEMNTLVRLLFIVVGCLVYLAIAYLLYSKLFGADKLYAVDAQDPTLLKRYKKK